LTTDYARTQANRYVEVLAALQDENLTSAERNKLESEKSYLLDITTQQIRQQTVEYAALTEAQKNAKKYEEDRTVLLEKQAILTAQTAQTMVTGKDGKTTMEEKLRFSATTNTAEYMDEAGKWIAITDVKNIEYARDIFNQQLKMQQELVIDQQKIA